MMPQFGPVIVCSAGGVLVELLKDVSVRLAPLSQLDAQDMVRGLRSFPLLTGYRGSPPRDVSRTGGDPAPGQQPG